MIYAEGTEIQDYINLLWTWKATVDNLSTSVVSDEAWRGAIIQSIPPTSKWLSVIPSLYAMTSLADIISTLFAHGMIIGRMTGSTSSSSTVLATQTTERCTNLNCKAKKHLTHMTANCYWLGGGKEGQFPLNFGQRNQANAATATTNTPVIMNTPISNPPEHFVLSA